MRPTPRACYMTSEGLAGWPPIRWNTPTCSVSPWITHLTCCTASGNGSTSITARREPGWPKQWKLPPELGMIAAHHHDEPKVREKPDLTMVVQLACRLADALDFGVIKTLQAHLPEEMLRACRSLRGFASRPISKR